jgi:hypothetical protein
LTHNQNKQGKPGETERLPTQGIQEHKDVMSPEKGHQIAPTQSCKTLFFKDALDRNAFG